MRRTGSFSPVVLLYHAVLDRHRSFTPFTHLGRRCFPSPFQWSPLSGRLILVELWILRSWGSGLDSGYNGEEFANVDETEKRRRRLVAGRLGSKRAVGGGELVGVRHRYLIHSERGGMTSEDCSRSTDAPTWISQPNRIQNH